jgi:hypothetical protein
MIRVRNEGWFRGNGPRTKLSGSLELFNLPQPASDVGPNPTPHSALRTPNSEPGTRNPEPNLEHEPGSENPEA